MSRKTTLLILLLLSYSLYAQNDYLGKFLSDSTMDHASVSLIILDADSGDVIIGHNTTKSFSQASVMKLVTTAAAIELLGPGYTFNTEIGYSGQLGRRSGVLRGDIIIKGGGDPVLGSEKYNDHYGSFMDQWIMDIKKLGIRKITGRVISDDSRYDYQPVPSGWNWEDIGNYYGAGVYGLSIFDNTLKIHFRTGNEGSEPVITGIEPAGQWIEYDNFLKSDGSSDQGYVYSAPYSKKGWISGKIPVNRDDFILKAAIPDPPVMTATLFNEKLRNAGIKIKGEPSSARILGSIDSSGYTPVAKITSPPLSSIIELLNHESVNLYAETLIKELGKVFNGEGTTAAGIKIVTGFLDSIGVRTSGMFIEDGSGLSPQNALNSSGLASLLYLMRKKGKYFESFYNSLPEAGKEGTLKNYFKDPLFESAMRAKSGTLIRVKSYAGYLSTVSGKDLIFCIIVNNFTGSSSRLIARIEELLKEVILYK